MGSPVFRHGAQSFAGELDICLMSKAIRISVLSRLDSRFTGSYMPALVGTGQVAHPYVFWRNVIIGIKRIKRLKKNIRPYRPTKLPSSLPCPALATLHNWTVSVPLANMYVPKARTCQLGGYWLTGPPVLCFDAPKINVVPASGRRHLLCRGRCFEINR